MSRMKKTVCVILISLYSAWLFTSCIPDPLEVDDIPAVKREIVVSSQMIPDSTVAVLLTRTFSALDANQDSDPEALLELLAITDATVTVHYEDQVDTLIHLGKGVYGQTYIPLVEGRDYTLNVYSPAMGQCTATTRVKRQIQFDELSASLYFDNFDDTLAQVTYHLVDPVEENYYMINTLKVSQRRLEENILNPRDYVRLFDDRAFNGQSKSETFRVFPTEFDPGDTLAVYLSNLSKEYYDFVKLRLDNRFSLAEYLSEPVEYPSNVVGGKGFFNLYVPDVRIIILEE
jgi:hypothetical protein